MSDHNVVIYSDDWNGHVLAGFVELSDVALKNWDKILDDSAGLHWWLNQKQCICFPTVQSLKNVLHVRTVSDKQYMWLSQNFSRGFFPPIL